jgi:hypothetical protein
MVGYQGLKNTRTYNVQQNRMKQIKQSKVEIYEQEKLRNMRNPSGTSIYGIPAVETSTTRIRLLPESDT